MLEECAEVVAKDTERTAWESQVTKSSKNRESEVNGTDSRSIT